MLVEFVNQPAKELSVLFVSVGRSALILSFFFVVVSWKTVEKV